MNPLGSCTHCGVEKFTGQSLSAHIAACPKNANNWRRRKKAMCKCTPEIRTPWCGRPGCTPEVGDSVKTDETLFYLQDGRTIVGNSIVWWAKGGRGYVCDIREAHVFTLDEVVQYLDASKNRVAWPKAYIDNRVSHHIDIQHCDKEDARPLLPEGGKNERHR